MLHDSMKGIGRKGIACLIHTTTKLRCLAETPRDRAIRFSTCPYSSCTRKIVRLLDVDIRSQAATYASNARRLHELTSQSRYSSTSNSISGKRATSSSGSVSRKSSHNTFCRNGANQGVSKRRSRRCGVRAVGKKLKEAPDASVSVMIQRQYGIPRRSVPCMLSSEER
eukprot:scaffold298543_cov39-Tisochrysis_lutea.AAC.1